MLFRAVIGAIVVLAITASTASADPDNSNTLTRTLECDNGRTVDAVFAGESGSNFNVTIDQSVFVYKMLVIDRPPIGEGGNDTVDVRGLQGLEVQRDLVTCQYVTPSGNHVTAVGFFTPPAP